MVLRTAVPTLAACAVALTSLTAAAAQFVVAKATYTHSGETTRDSHYYVAPSAETPANWRSPIDYARGTAYVQLEVLTKPTDTPTRYQICFEAPPEYACTQQAPAYTTTGVYTWSTPFPNFFQYDRVDWAGGIRRSALILKDVRNGKPSPDNVGAEVAALYMPTDLRVTVTIVSPGGTYVPPVHDEPTPDAGPPPTDAGVPPAPDAGVDTGPPPDPGMAPTPREPLGARPPAPPVIGGCAEAPGAAAAWSPALLLLGLLLRGPLARANRRP